MASARTLHRRVSKWLPQIVGTSGVVMDEPAQRGLLSLLFALRRRPGGAVVFRLCGRTRAAMQDDPLAYLQSVPVTDGGGRRFRPWCIVQVPVAQPHTDPLQTMPLLFTTRTDGKAWVVVLPAEGQAIYAWRGDT